MPTSKKPRKKYTGKYRLIPGATPVVFGTKAGDDSILKLTPHVELDRFRDGTADGAAYNTLAERVGWGYVMAGEVFDNPDAREVTVKGLNAIRSIFDRKQRTGKYGITQEEYTLIGDALNMTDELQSNSTRREQRDTLRALYIINDYKRAQHAQENGKTPS